MHILKFHRSSPQISLLKGTKPAGKVQLQLNPSDRNGGKKTVNFILTS